MVPKNVPTMAPASVPPEYCPEHEVEGLVMIVVVACRAMRAGVAGRRAEARVARGACARMNERNTGDTGALEGGNYHVAGR